MASKAPAISVIIPAFNEEQSIAFVLQELRQALESLALPFELVVVDDGSTDNTAQYASAASGRVIRHPTNRGKGASIVAGMRATQGHVVLTIDADGSNAPSDIPTLVQPVIRGQADIVVGTRFKGIWEKSPHPSLFRSVGNFLLNMVFLAVSGFRIQDSQSGFRVYRRIVFDRIETERRGYDWETEILLKAIGTGFRVREVPIVYRERIGGTSHLSILRDAPRIVIAMIKYRTRWSRR